MTLLFKLILVVITTICFSTYSCEENDTCLEFSDLDSSFDGVVKFKLKNKGDANHKVMIALEAKMNNERWVEVYSCIYGTVLKLIPRNLNIVPGEAKLEWSYNKIPESLKIYLSLPLRLKAITEKDEIIFSDEFKIGV